jgi:hypothetical protein
MNGIAPCAWAKQTLERIANRWPKKDIEALMPWNFKPTEERHRMSAYGLARRLVKRRQAVEL